MISFGVLLKNSWDIYKKHFLLFLGVVLPIVVVNIIVSILEIIPSPLSSIFVVVGNIAGFLLSILVGISLIYAVKEREEGITAKEALKKGWKRFFSYWWLTVLSVVIPIGGFFLLVIPGIIISVWFSVVGYVFVAEDRTGMTALLRSKHLVSGHWWGVFWRFFSFGIITFLIFLPVLLLTASIGFSLGLSLEQIFMGEGSLSVINIPISIMVWLIAGFSAVFGYLLYENLRDLKRDAVFEEPKKSTKVKFLLVGAFGVIVPFLFLVTTVVVLFVSVFLRNNAPLGS